MESALGQIKELARAADDATRRGIMAALHDLHLQTAAAKIGFDLGLFKLLAKAEGSLELEDIATATGADIALLSRYMRYLASVGAVKEVAKDQYMANNVTKNLAGDAVVAGISHAFLTLSPMFQALPGFLKKSSYKEPTDEMHTVFQEAMKTPLHAFDWISAKPEDLQHFNNWMALRRQPDLTWLTVYPITVEVADLTNSQRAIFVDIGGGIGHQCVQFKGKYPDVQGRLITQDLELAINNAPPTPNVEFMVHNFFDPQPVKGAKFYYLRTVLHNHPDYKVQQILKHIKAAMASDSVLLIDEMVLPESGVNSYTTAIDLTMMSAFAAMERTEAQWRNIITDAGLSLVKTYPYNNYESVMDVRPL
ncbi:hypothetical protein JX266_009358 [Neoarthrinium moseri]|uniref:uncharacterized protein n=1 Tax=Neoarthrinium moseri TaxID=1658444 RepID=UPI001FDD2444|nr:uncharacterized protein JN550_012062 [Neoarthrinium moseri]KAI1844471.1 hypothetical protein JX266_009358 [Neoarthrinium moseri]KAI1859544.1 hypothetical protein JN550_012062 [Neoarthrinium moseri]